MKRTKKVAVRKPYALNQKAGVHKDKRRAKPRTKKGEDMFDI